jgi:hypothetical protein
MVTVVVTQSVDFEGVLFCVGGNSKCDFDPSFALKAALEFEKRILIVIHTHTHPSPDKKSSDSLRKWRGSHKADLNTVTWRKREPITQCQSCNNSMCFLPPTQLAEASEARSSK